MGVLRYFTKAKSQAEKIFTIFSNVIRTLSFNLFQAPNAEMDDDITTQNDEIEALSSIYDQDLIFLPSSSGKSFEIKMGQACFRVHLPAD